VDVRIIKLVIRLPEFHHEGNKMPRAKDSFESRMKKLRLKSSLSLKQLANETGYSSEYLGKIEKGQVIPPVSAIIQIAKALSVESGTFLSAEQQKESEERRRKSFLIRTESYAYQTLTPGAENKHLKAFLVTVDPKKEHTGVDYHHEGEEFIYVLEGKVEMMVGEERNVLSAGQSLHFNSAISHKLRNLVDRPAKLIGVIYTP
jgi:quercetin dioxygenase-like cupin family protein